MGEEAEAGARVLVNLNASPYSRGRREERLAVLAERVAETGCAIVYVNQVGGQDELVFDGASLVLGADGALLASAAPFEEEVLLVDVEAPAADGRRDRRRHARGRGVREPASRLGGTAAARARSGPRARTRSRGLRGAGARHPRLHLQERLQRRGDRSLRWDRLLAGRHHRRRRPRARSTCTA